MKSYYSEVELNINNKLKITKPLALVVDDYHTIFDFISKDFSRLSNKKMISENVILIFYSIHINFERLIENLLLLNYDICFKILRTIIEQIIIFTSLCNNDESMAYYFINWDLLANINDYSFKKVGKDYQLCKNDLDNFIKLKCSHDTKKADKVIKDLIKNNYGWYYKKWDFKSDLNLYKIAEQEKILDIYDLFRKYSLNIHNNKLRTILKQNKYEVKYGCRVVIGLFKSLSSILKVLQKITISEDQELIPVEDVDVLIYSKLAESIIEQNEQILKDEEKNTEN
jgi:hypothetical protein